METPVSRDGGRIFVLLKHHQGQQTVLGWADALDARDACDIAEFAVHGKFVAGAMAWDQATSAEQAEALRLGEQKGRL